MQKKWKELMLGLLALCLAAGNWSVPEAAYGRTYGGERIGGQEGAMAAGYGEKELEIDIKASKKTKIKITLSSSKITLEKGKSKNLKAKVKGIKKKVKWSSSNKSVAVVNQKGKVTAKKVGTAVIRAKVNGVSAACRVTVNQTLTRKQAETALVNYVERKETTSFWYFYEGKEGNYYTFWVTYRMPGTKAKYFVNRKNGKSYVCAIYVGVDEWKPSDPKKYIFSAYNYLR